MAADISAFYSIGKVNRGPHRSLVVGAALANEKYSQSIYGSFTLAGDRATGTVGGALQTLDKNDSGLFHGTLNVRLSLRR